MSIRRNHFWYKPFVDRLGQRREGAGEAIWLAMAEKSTREMRRAIPLCLCTGIFFLYRVLFSPIAHSWYCFLLGSSVFTVITIACLPALYRWRARKARAAVSSTKPPSA